MDSIDDLPEELLKTDPGDSVAVRLNDENNLEFNLQDTEDTTDTSVVSSTYQIVAQQLISPGQVQLTLSDGVNIIQTTIPAEQLQGIETGEHSVMLQTTVSENNFLSSNAQTVLTDDVNQSVLNHSATNDTVHLTSQSQDFLQTRLDNNQSEKLFQVINQQTTVTGMDGVTENQNNNSDTSIFIKPSTSTEPFYITATDNGDNDDNDDSMINNNNDVDTTYDKALYQNDQDNSQDMDDEVTPETEITEPTAVKPVSNVTKDKKKPDLTKPIEVTDHMEVVVNGKKCLLKVNPDTGQLCAYPLITSGKRRGRPKKSETVTADASDKSNDSLVDINQPGTTTTGESDTTNTAAAESLLELYNTGPDGVRRSTRSRGKPKTLQEYEVLEISSDDDGADVGDDEVLPTGAVRKKKIHKDYIPTTPIQTPGVPKRGRGRPRRYPRSDDTISTNQIPAIIIPSGDNQTIMMAPIQGLTNLEAFQEQVKNMPIFQQSVSEDESLQYLNISNLIDNNDSTSAINFKIDTTGTLDVNDDVTTSNTTLDDTKQLPGTDIGDKDVKSFNDSKEKLVDEKSGDKKLGSDTGDGETQPTIIQIPENLLPMFTQKKDPVKIGLKASDGLLEKLKCQSCDFQAYYEQQYQEHILTHDEVIKCKCCQFVTFEKQDLIEHFKKKHPRCICIYCDHMAEHAYIIKRHTMRHTQIGCKCDVCGKVYKDQYVLKMHVKMVHLPADILFECNVCGKKFTRKAHLKRHIRIHDPEKPFKCPQCEYRGCERSDIVKHLLVHEDPKHKCNICNKSFRHIKNKELHMKRHNGQRDYKCGVCDFYGYTFTDIRKHIERKHTDCRPLICDKCGMVFGSDLLYQEHKNSGCDVLMIEQALCISTSNGGTTQATVQFPSSYTFDGTQQLQVGNQNVSVDKGGQFIVHSVGLPGEGITLTDEQLQAVAQGQMTETELQTLMSQAQLGESVLQSNTGQSELINTEHVDESVTVLHTIGGTDSDASDISRQVFDVLKPEGDVNNGAQPVLMFKNGVTVALAEDVDTTMNDEDEEEDDDNDDMKGEPMDGIVSDTDDKTGVNNDQILAMVNLPDV
ncbi:hypothetical protein ACF0H5_007637 [Mactra antiquata]